MAKVKRFKDINENNNVFNYSDWLDRDLLQGVIDGMKPRSEHDGETWKEAMREFNNLYPVVNQERLPSSFNKQVADWVDLDLVQDVIDRMNPRLCDKSEEYKRDLKEMLADA